MKHRIMQLTLLTLGLTSLVTCEALVRSRGHLTASLRTDSTEIGVHSGGNAYFAKIGFVYVNNTGKPVSRAGCGGPGWPQLEKGVNGRWVPAYYAVYMVCRTIPDFWLESGMPYRDVLQFIAYERGHNTGPELLVDSIDGVYRLRWDFTEGRDATARGARRVEAISNEFRMVLR